MRISAGERLLGVLGYLAFLFIIPVKLRRDSMFVQFHARQGGVLFGLWATLSLLLVILLAIAGANSLLQTLLIALFFAATILYLFLALVGILKVALGERYRMPVVADVALMLKL